MEFVTGTGEFRQKAGPVSVEVHPDYSEKCLEIGYECPDIAVIKLPADVYNSASYIEYTDPAEIDFLNKSFPRDEAPILAGFGCWIAEGLISGRCSAPTFQSLTYSVATDLGPRTDRPLSLPPHYFQFDGKNTRGEAFAVGNGDSGSPLFRELPIPKQIRVGDIKSFIVDGMAEYTDIKEGGFGSSVRYDNVVLDLASDKVSSWLKSALVETGIQVAPMTSLDVISRCDPFDVKVDVENSPFNIPAWTTSRLGGAPQLVADDLNKFRNWRTAIGLGQCIRYIEESATKLDATAKNHPNYVELMATFDAARATYDQILIIVLELQDAKDDEFLSLANLHAIRLRGEYEIANAFFSTTPGFALVYDILILYTGEDLLGEVSGLDYGFTAMTLIVPGVIKGFAKSAGYLKKSVDVAEKTGKYVFKSARVNKVMTRMVKSIRGVEDSYAALLETGKKLGFDTTQKMREFLSLSEKMNAVCNIQ